MQDLDSTTARVLVVEPELASSPRSQAPNRVPRAAERETISPTPRALGAILLFFALVGLLGSIESGEGFHDRGPAWIGIAMLLCLYAVCGRTVGTEVDPRGEPEVRREADRDGRDDRLAGRPRLRLVPPLPVSMDGDVRVADGRVEAASRRGERANDE